jgi:hypothetical protein
LSVLREANSERGPETIGRSSFKDPAPPDEGVARFFPDVGGSYGVGDDDVDEACFCADIFGRKIGTHGNALEMGSCGIYSVLDFLGLDLLIRIEVESTRAVRLCALSIPVKTDEGWRSGLSRQIIARAPEYLGRYSCNAKSGSLRKMDEPGDGASIGSELPDKIEKHREIGAGVPAIEERDVRGYADAGAAERLALTCAAGDIGVNLRDDFEAATIGHAVCGIIVGGELGLSEVRDSAMTGDEGILEV